MAIDRSMNRCDTCNHNIKSFETEDKILNSIYSATLREYAILLYRFIEKKDLADVGRIMSCTRERIRQLECKAFKRIIYRANLDHKIKLTEQDVIDFLRRNQDKLKHLEKKEIFIVNTQISRADQDEWTAVKVKRQQEYIEFQAPDEIKNLPITKLDVGIRGLNCLKVIGVNTINDLLQLTEDDLCKIKNFGRKSLREVKESLQVYQLGLKTLKSN